MRPQVGQVINNKYRLVRVIGDGGMGSVYEARHEVLGTTVALKFLHPELSRRQGLVQRFLQEARVSAQIQSPHVVRVSDVDQTSTGQAFIVMEYLEGKTLQTLYEELYHAGQRLSYADALEYASQMLDGVEAAHRAGVVHRDLKPDNVMITRGSKGEPLLKLLDFGIAKLKVTGELDRGLTRPGVIMGTPEYMAPEQAYSADAVDVRADIFSLGVMVFEMLAGRRPVGGDEPHQIASAYLTGQIAQLTDLAPHVPPELASVVHRAMGPKPPDRYNSVAEFRSALEPFAIGTRSGAAGAAVATPLPGSVTPKPAVSPAAAVTPGAAGASPIPKTLPPTDDKPPPGVSEPSIPPPQVGATPLGGFDAPPHRQPHTSIGEPLTESLSPSPRYDATAPAAPLASHTAPPGAYDMSPRPGGTAIGQALPAGGYGPVQTNYGAAPGYPPANGYPAPPGYGPTSPMNPIGARPTHQAQQKRSGGSSIALMLLLATVVTGVVVGGVYVGQKLTSKEESGSEPVTLQPPTTTVVSSDPGAQQPSQTTGAANTNLPVPQTTVPKTTTTVGGTKPPGTTSGAGTSTPQPSASGSTAPTGIPNPFGSNGIPIPWGSTQIPLPFPIPGQPTAQPTNTTPAPTATPTQTTPTPRPSTSGSGRPRIRIPIPGQNP
ncbi:serine/threonine-protein kinase [Polyangium jinanense]|uniref:Protein kinase n=1 Tax=Polyangium jinanense TaxID=2829994 RepID=A0A9X3XB77_9BACT|nr:serine/threonine-protein kinase [Polyangium jinanense]MDC3959402.1 protein kinase [Polyangium jinanense]MDC3984836.1 protein kinase [Polyangium jinanense]